MLKPRQSSKENPITVVDIWNCFWEKEGFRCVQADEVNHSLSPRSIDWWEKKMWLEKKPEDNKYCLTKKGQQHIVQKIRQAVESAMDAYDEYQRGKAKEKHRLRFDMFADDGKVDYYVCSSRRNDPLYPSKPIAYFVHADLLADKKFLGGWGDNNAAALLHNQGFIIVNERNEPIMESRGNPPQAVSNMGHLIREAVRIRMCAFNYYIAPARERGDSSVSIRVGELHDKMGLENAYSNVSQALGGKKLQDLASVSISGTDGPNESSTTIFTFNLEKDMSSKLQELYKQLLKDENRNDWHDRYLDFYHQVKATCERIKAGARLSYPEDEAFLDKLLRKQNNGIASSGMSILSGPDFQSLTQSEEFLSSLEQFMRDPNSGERFEALEGRMDRAS